MPTRITADDVLKYRSVTTRDASSARHEWAALDLNPIDGRAFYQFNSARQAESEDELHKNLSKLTTGHGARHDHPLVAKTIMESFKHMPKLQRLYANA